MSDPDVMFEVDRIAHTLSDLLRGIALEARKTRRPKSLRHFSITCQAYPADPNMIDGTVHVQEATPIEGENPLTVLESFDEGLEL